jgi:hypothetical protein
MPLSLEDAKRLIQQYVDRYNDPRLHSAIGYVTPKDCLQADTFLSLRPIECWQTVGILPRPLNTVRAFAGGESEKTCD